MSMPAGASRLSHRSCSLAVLHGPLADSELPTSWVGIARSKRALQRPQGPPTPKIKPGLRQYMLVCLALTVVYDG